MTRTTLPRVASEPVAGAIADEAESDEDEAEDQPGVVRADQAAGGERRPRRRGRRGGRRRRGGPEDGLAGSIADELGPTSAPEATSAVADFDGYSPQPVSLPEVEPETLAPPPEQHAGRACSAGTGAGSRVYSVTTETETAQEAEAPRRDGVRPCAKKSASWPMPSRKQRRRPSTTARPSLRRPAAAEPAPAGPPPRKTPNPAKPAGGRAVSVTANRRSRISETKKPPGKTGRFFLCDRHSSRAFTVIPGQPAGLNPNPDEFMR